MVSETKHSAGNLNEELDYLVKRLSGDGVFILGVEYNRKFMEFPADEWYCPFNIWLARPVNGVITCLENS